jgi:hypothetical protein
MKISEIFEVTHVCTLNFSVLDKQKCELLLRVAGQIYPVTVLEPIDGALLIQTISIKGMRQRVTDVKE